MSFIYLLPIGSIEDEVLTVLEQRLHRVFDWEIRRGTPLHMPTVAFNAARKQYEALHVMRHARWESLKKIYRFQC